MCQAKGRLRGPLKGGNELREWTPNPNRVKPNEATTKEGHDGFPANWELRLLPQRRGFFFSWRQCMWRLIPPAALNSNGDLLIHNLCLPRRRARLEPCAPLSTNTRSYLPSVPIEAEVNSIPSSLQDPEELIRVRHWCHPEIDLSQRSRNRLAQVASYIRPSQPLPQHSAGVFSSPS